MRYERAAIADKKRKRTDSQNHNHSETLPPVLFRAMIALWTLCVFALLLRGSTASTAAAAPASTWRSRLRDRSAGARAPAASIFVPATDASVTTVGRTIRNADGSQTFDWEGTNFALSVSGASFVKVMVNVTGGILGLFSCEVDGWEVTRFYVGGGNGAITENTFMCAYDLHDNNRHVRLVQTLEPAFAGANANAAFTLLGFETDGTVAAPAPRTRNIELVGDSISAGYGARGYAGAPNGCPVDDNTSGNKYTYNWQLAEALNANIVPIAWSGKGMYQNCCDNGETMPSYYLQTLAGRAYSTDWDFSRYVPDMMLINLGTNDFGHDSGPAWEAAFSATYAAFVYNATVVHYQKPKLPIFVAQGPMNCGAPLNASLHVAIAAINAAGGNAFYLDMCSPPNDGCGGASSRTRTKSCTGVHIHISPRPSLAKACIDAATPPPPPPSYTQPTAPVTFHTHTLDLRLPPSTLAGHPGVKGHQGMFQMALPVIQSVMGW